MEVIKDELGWWFDITTQARSLFGDFVTKVEVLNTHWGTVEEAELYAPQQADNLLYQIKRFNQIYLWDSAIRLTFQSGDIIRFDFSDNGNISVGKANITQK